MCVNVLFRQVLFRRTPQKDDRLHRAVRLQASNISVISGRLQGSCSCCWFAPMFLRFYDAADQSVRLQASNIRVINSLARHGSMMKSARLQGSCSCCWWFRCVVPMLRCSRMPTTIGSPSTAKQFRREWFQGDDMARRMNELSNGIQPGKELVN
uniref:Uncharacterized protein n=1 Tax=Caenorhabditis japonica TaxID=281687 RepID=A0A8R1IWU5_CAEJA